MPKQAVVDLFEAHFPFFMPIGANNDRVKDYREEGVDSNSLKTFLPEEKIVADGWLTTLGEKYRLKGWSEILGDPWYHGVLDCTHELWVPNPGRERIRCFRAHDGQGRWDAITSVSISRFGGSASVHVMLSHPAWYPEGACVALRTYEEENWNELLKATAGAARTAGTALRSVSVDLGHYIFNERWKAVLLPLARSIPSVEIE